MRAQALSIDSTVALALFLFTAAGVIATVQAQAGDTGSGGRSAQVVDRLVAEISIESSSRDLLLSSPTEVSNYPVDRELGSVAVAKPDVASFEIPASVNTTSGKFVSVPDLRNRSIRLSYLSANTTNPGPALSNDLTTKDPPPSGFLRNSKIKLTLSDSNQDPGLKDLINRQINRDLLRQGGEASIPGSDTSTSERNLSASSLSDNLKIYNGSPEFIVEEGPANFSLKNLSEVYVLNGTKSISIENSGFQREFSTRALAVTEPSSSTQSGGLALAGDLTATVENVTSGVNLNVSFDDRLRVRTVSGFSEGRHRSLAERGQANFGPVKTLNTGWVPSRANLSAIPNPEFRTRLDIPQNVAYNISLGGSKSVGSPPWNPAATIGTDVDDGDLVLNSTQENSRYVEQHATDIGPTNRDGSVRRITVSVEDLPEGINLDLQLDTPSRIYGEDLSEGDQTFDFRTNLVESFNIRFVSAREGNPNDNWTIDSYEVVSRNTINRGSTLPPTGEVDADTRPLLFLRPDGSFSTAVAEVRTWR